MVSAFDYQILTILFGFSALFTTIMAALFLYLRMNLEGEVSTQSQKWAISILAALFILNAVYLWLSAFGDYLNVLHPEGVPQFSNFYASNFISRLLLQLEMVSALLLFFFGLVYPRPRLRWDRLGTVIVGGSAFCILLIFLSWEYFFLTHMIVGYYITSRITFTLGWLVPLYLWIGDYKKETTRQGKMILVLFIWSYLFQPLINEPANVLNGFIVNTPDPNTDVFIRVIGNIINIPFSAFIILFALMIVKILFDRRGHWSKAEWTNAGFLVVAVIFSTIFFVGNVTRASLMAIIVGGIGWIFIRPLLLAYGLLRYQAFGSMVKAEKVLSWIIGMIVVSLFATLAGAILGWSSPVAAIGWAVVAGTVTFLFLRGRTERWVKRLLPMSDMDTAESMRERRFAYLISLRSAVTDGELDKEDAPQLENLSKRLGISSHEHELLMKGLSGEKGRDRAAPKINEIFLMTKDGRLISHWSGVADTEMDKDLVASMVVAIKGFVEEGLRGEEKQLSGINYGDSTLVMETGEGIILTALVQGQDTPELRETLHDALRIVTAKFGDILKDWDGDVSTVRPAGDLVTRTLGCVPDPSAQG